MVITKRPSPESVDTVADIANLLGLQDGQVLPLLGYYAVGDGGGQQLVYHSTGKSAITVDNGVYFAGIDSDDYFEATDKTRLHVQNFGAVPDDNTKRAVNDAAIAAMQTATGIIRIPEGEFFISTDIVLADYQVLIGESRAQSYLSSDSTGDIVTYEDYSEIRNIRINGPGYATSTGAAILSAGDASRTIITGVHLTQCQYGIEMASVANVYVGDFIINNCYDGIWFDSSDGGGALGQKYINEVSFNDGLIESCGNDGIVMDGAMNVVSFNDVTVQGNARYGVYRDGDAGLATTVPQNVTFYGCWFEQNTDTQIKFDGTVLHSRFIGCRVSAYTTQDGIDIGATRTVSHIQFEDIRLSVDSGVALQLDSNAYNILMRNVVDAAGQGVLPTGAGATANRNRCWGMDNMYATTDPTAANNWDSFYAEGSRWRNTSTGEMFVCTDRAGTWVLEKTPEGEDYTWTGTQAIKSATTGTLTLQTSAESVTSANTIGALEAQAPNEAAGSGAGIAVCAAYRFEAQGAFSTTYADTDHVWYTTKGGAALSEVMRYDATSDFLVVGSGSGSTLYVKGTTGSSGAQIWCQTQRTAVSSSNIIGTIYFSAPDEASGGIAVDTVAMVRAKAVTTFDAVSNATDLEFYTANNGTVTRRGRFRSDGRLVVEHGIGAYNVTPSTTQPTAIADVSTGDVPAYETAINAIIAALENAGLVAT